MCYVSCKGGAPYTFRRMHQCPSARYFTDVTIIEVERGEQGSADLFVAAVRDSAVDPATGQRHLTWKRVNRYDPIDLELGSCRQYQLRMLGTRHRDMEGRHPGEDELGNPLPPRQ
jgi:hypothetical protein